MTTETAAFLTITGAALVTYSFRIGGLLLAERTPKSPRFKAFMEALPGTILLSLVVPGILAAGTWGLIAAFVTGLCARLTGNLFLSMGLGIAIMAVHRNFLP
jgi:uncharacterized membrane protein